MDKPICVRIPHVYDEREIGIYYRRRAVWLRYYPIGKDGPAGFELCIRAGGGYHYHWEVGRYMPEWYMVFSREVPKSKRAALAAIRRARQGGYVLLEGPNVFIKRYDTDNWTFGCCGGLTDAQAEDILGTAERFIRKQAT